MDKESYFIQGWLSCFFPFSFCSISSVSSPVFLFTVIKLRQLTEEIVLDYNSFVVRRSPETSNTVELSMNKILILLSSLLLLSVWIKRHFERVESFSIRCETNNQIKVYPRCPKTQLLLVLKIRTYKASALDLVWLVGVSLASQMTTLASKVSIEI